MALGPEHAAFTAWAQEQGVVIDGVAAAGLPGKGVGIVAARRLKKGDTILTIPASALITHDAAFVRAAGITQGTVYGTVAAALALNHGNEDRWWKTWQATWPTRADLELSMPLCWAPAAQELLPSAAKTLLQKQREKFERDVESMRPRLARDAGSVGLGDDWEAWYRYYWLIVNTRCFYWVYFRKVRDLARRGKKLPRDECLALVPWGDYFNHADAGCEVVENAKGVTVVCDRNYNKGEEVVVSYGAHTNDFLLVEYGFILATNKHDATTLDHIVLPLLTAAQRDMLDRNAYLGSYYLTSAGFCYRTQVTVRAMVTSGKRLQQFLDGEYDGAGEEEKVDAKSREICRAVEGEIEDGVRATNGLEGHAVEVLLQRWKQLGAMLKEAEAAMFEAER